MPDDSILTWLLQGDVSVQYQTRRDLLHEDPASLLPLRARIAAEGWGAAFLAERRPDGHWGLDYYRPKWTSTHYTLLELANMEAPPDVPGALDSVRSAFDRLKGRDGGINASRTHLPSDVCVNGMALRFACHFGLDQDRLRSVVDFILSQRMPDGGFNCMSNRARGAVHSSLHTTLSVMEGIAAYGRGGYAYRLPELTVSAQSSVEFLLQHRLYKSHRTGEVIDEKMLRLTHPCRWRYDILRALDCLRAMDVAYDPRMDDALAVLRSKRLPNGAWPLQGRHPGEVFFDMEEPGKTSRWNTLRALRVLDKYADDDHP